jgi:ADP-ribose pyrophosphatase
MISKINSKVVYQNKWMTVREDQVKFPNGHEGIYGVVEKPHFALIIPFDGQSFYLVQQYRYPVEKLSWEFPQGSLEQQPDVSPEDVARQELAEETGLQAGRMVKVGFFYEAIGYSTQGFHLFLAQDLVAGKAQREETEQGMTMEHISIEKFERMIVEGEVTDAPSISAYGLLKAGKWI